MISEAHNIDVMEYMKNIPDDKFDLAICDPPYGIKQDGRNNHTRGKSAFGKGGALAKAKDYRDAGTYDDESPSDEFFSEIMRISKNQIFFGANHYISKLPINASCWIVWDKENGDSDFADCELAWTSFKTAVRRFKYKWNGMLQQDMTCKEIRVHPNHKPVALYDWILSKYANKGDFIFDPMMGGQSSRIACFNKGFNYIGCELNPVHFKTGSKRYNEHEARYSLLMPREDEILNNDFTLE